MLSGLFSFIFNFLLFATVLVVTLSSNNIIPALVYLLYVWWKIRKSNKGYDEYTPPHKLKKSGKYGVLILWLGVILFLYSETSA